MKYIGKRGTICNKPSYCYITRDLKFKILNSDLFKTTIMMDAIRRVAGGVVETVQLINCYRYPSGELVHTYSCTLRVRYKDTNVPYGFPVDQVEELMKNVENEIIKSCPVKPVHFKGNI